MDGKTASTLAAADTYRRGQLARRLDLISPLFAGVGGFFGSWIGGFLVVIFVGPPVHDASLSYLVFIIASAAVFSGLLAAALCPCTHRSSSGIAFGRIGAFLGGILGIVGLITPPFTLFLGRFATILFPAVASLLFHTVVPAFKKPK